MYRDQFGEFVCGCWGLKGQYACTADYQPKWLRGPNIKSQIVKFFQVTSINILHDKFGEV